MAISEEIYERSRRCLDDAAALIDSLIHGKTITPADISARRTTADIAADTAFRLLRQAFITPIDREDLWILWNMSEAVLRTAEDTAQTLYCAGRGLPLCCTVVAGQTADTCTAVAAVVTQFPNMETLACVQHTIRHAERICLETERAVFADQTARRVCQMVTAVIRTCENLVNILRYCALKNT